MFFFHLRKWQDNNEILRTGSEPIPIYDINIIWEAFAWVIILWYVYLEQYLISHLALIGI